MSIYANRLTRAERAALRKHTHDFTDEVDLLRTLIARELDGTANMDRIANAIETMTKAALTRHRLQTTPDDELRLALQAALAALDEADT